MSGTGAALTGKLQALLEPVLRDHGFDLEDLTVTQAGRRRQVRVVVDRDGGLSLDDVAEVSAAVSEVLDSSDALGETPYVLEVSSPGVDRPLRQPRHWRRAAGRLVTVEVPGEGPLTARIESADEHGVTLHSTDGTVSASRRRLPYSVLGPGAVQVEFDRPAPDEGDPADGEGLADSDGLAAGEELAGGDVRR